MTYSEQIKKDMDYLNSRRRYFFKRYSYEKRIENEAYNRLIHRMDKIARVLKYIHL